MSVYGDFATVYDTFMDGTPYEVWKEMIVAILKKYNINDGIVLDLGCGTGKMTRLLRDEGYDMIGIDASDEMLNIAREVQMDEGDTSILYLCQDMRDFELYGTVRAIVSVCDCINYLTTDEDVIKTFKLANNYLDKEGLFIFDFNTVHKYRDIIGNKTIAENREDCSFIWDNEYDEATGLNEYDLTLFIREDKLDILEDNDDIPEDELLFARFHEEHIQKGYELADIVSMLETAGMEFVMAMDTDTKESVSEKSQRITVVAREKYNKDKTYIDG